MTLLRGSTLSRSIRPVGNKSKIEDFIERLECNYDPEGVCGPQHGNSIYPTGTPGPGTATVVSGQIPTGVQSGNVMPGQKVETPLPGDTPIPGSPSSGPASPYGGARPLPRNAADTAGLAGGESLDRGVLTDQGKCGGRALEAELVELELDRDGIVSRKAGLARTTAAGC